MQFSFRTSRVLTLGMLAIVVGGCRREAERAAAPPAPVVERPGEQAAKEALPPDLVEPSSGKEPTSRQAFRHDWEQPLVENVAALKRLDPDRPVWVDRAGRRVVLAGMVCKQSGPLELFACLANSKEYESVVAIDVPAHLIQAGLLSLGVDPGNPAQFVPEFAPPKGPIVEVHLVWQDKKGQRQHRRAQEWVRRVGSQEAMDQPWVFAGSRFFRSEETGKEIFAADVTGDLISVANFADSVFDIPVPSSQSDAELLYEAFTERIPPRGTPVTILLEPKTERVAHKEPAEKGTATR